jgi:Leucine-rich repeat (LRR) protein
MMKSLSKGGMKERSSRSTDEFSSGSPRMATRMATGKSRIAKEGILSSSSRGTIVLCLIVLISCLLTEKSSATASFQWPEVPRSFQPSLHLNPTSTSLSSSSSALPYFFYKTFFPQRNYNNLNSNRFSHFPLDTWCTPENRRLLEPDCTCRGPDSFAIIKCSNVTGGQQRVRTLLTTRFPINDFGRLFISNSSMPTIDRYSLTGEKAFVVVSLTRTDTTSIDLASLESSRLSLKRLEVTHNLLESFPFANLTRFKRLSHIDLSYNNIKTIPENAFGHNDQIGYIDLSFNKISYVGSHAFNQLPSLQLLDLSYNRLKVLNNYAFAMLLPSKDLTLDLTHNKIFFIANDSFTGLTAKELLLDSNSLTKMPEKHFKPLLTSMMIQREGVISVEGKRRHNIPSHGLMIRCSYSLSPCLSVRDNDIHMFLSLFYCHSLYYWIFSDNRFACSCKDTSWLILLPASYKERIQGFSCSSLESTQKKRLQELTLTDIECF